MEQNEAMAIEELMEPVTEEIVKASPKCGFKMAAGFGLGLLAGVAICKLAKPIMAKIMAHRKTQIIDAKAVEVEYEAEEESEE